MGIIVRRKANDLPYDHRCAKSCYDELCRGASCWHPPDEEYRAAFLPSPLLPLLKVQYLILYTLYDNSEWMYYGRFVFFFG